MTMVMQFDTGRPEEDLTPTTAIEVGHIVTDVLGDAWVVLVSVTLDGGGVWLELRDASMERINIAVAAADVDKRTWHVVGSPADDLYND